jgi:hypothetical protein
MAKRKLILPVLLCVTLVTLFLYSTKPARAFSFQDILTKVESIFKGTNQQKQITVDAKVELAPNGDINHNGKITSGDMVTFTYTITNPTNISYPLLTLKTNLDTSTLNNITNIQGAASIDESNKTITIPNINIEKDNIRTISFRAQISFSKDRDISLSTEPHLISQNGGHIATNEKQTFQILKMDEATFNKFVHITK